MPNTHFLFLSFIGAVARKVDHSDRESYDTLELFDTKSHLRHKVKDVLQASADAPCFFPTPVTVGDSKYVDGGVGGNCPLAQAIPRLKQIYANSEFNSALSIAPPRFAIGKYAENAVLIVLCENIAFKQTCYLCVASKQG